MLMTYLGYAFLLILIYLVVNDAEATNKVLGGLSAANIGAIKALQGR